MSKVQLENDYMFGGTGKHGLSAKRLNFAQADKKLAEQLNKSPELASLSAMDSGK